MKRVLHEVVVHRDKIVSFVIHEVIEIAVRIAVAHLLALDICEFEFFAGVKGTFENASGHDVTHFNAHERRALAGFDVLKIHDYLNGIVEFERIAFSQIAC